MKRILSFLCAVILVPLCACGASEIVPLSKGIGITAHISYYNESYNTDISIDDSGVFTMKINEPDVLSGISFVLSRDSVKAIYNGIEYTPNENNTQFFGVADKIYRVFKDIEGKTAKEDDGIYVLEGKIGDDDYEITFGKMGLPLTLELDDNITVRFSDAKIVN